MKQSYVLVAAAAMLVPASAAMAVQVGTGAEACENNAANAALSDPELAAAPRIIWRKPEIRPRRLEEQRVFDRSSRPFATPQN